ncbi:MAG: DUF4105 domain-containing protein [Deltaproteobacteria bacterium]|nr:DUF4105 domain-containing protein [Deltaproteobacteria bacterium]
MGLLRYAVAAALLVGLCSSNAGAAEDGTAPARFEVSVLIMGQGPELFARFGHIALLVEDRQAKTQKVYNFGTFDFGNPALRFKYLKGYLIYWLSVQSLPTTVRTYRHYDRTLEQRALNLDPAAAERLAKKLAENAKPENREYEYRHYMDNCCTRIRDLVDEAGGGAVGAGRKGKPTGRTFRDLTRWSLQGVIASNVVIDFALGPAIDQPLDRWAEEFLPAILAEDLDLARRPDGAPLVAAKTVLFSRAGPPLERVHEPWDVPVAAAFLALLALGLLVPIGLGARFSGLSTRLAALGLSTWAFFGGVGGVLLAVMWAWTTHYDTHGNENLLCFPPTHVFLFVPALVLIFRGRLGPTLDRLTGRYLRAAAILVVAALLLKLRAHPQQNYGFMAFGFLMDLACLAALRRTLTVDH